MIFPYKVKNPVKNTPYATYMLIAINIIVFALTSEYLLYIREDALEFGFKFGHSSPLTLITSGFLHADIFHIAGNMLFLWIFGRPVEDRLGIAKYLLVFFAAGIIGTLTQGLLGSMILRESVPCIGASASIMGIMGAYLYMYSWSPVCVFYWLGIIWHGVWQIAAIWVIGIYFVTDLFWGILYGSAHVNNGVGNFAHVFGVITGYAYCYFIKAKKDSEAMSAAKAVLTNNLDFSDMNLWELYAVSEDDPKNPDILSALIYKAARENKTQIIDEVMGRAGHSMIDIAPKLVTSYLIDHQGNSTIYPAVHLLRLGSICEKEARFREAVKMYQIIVQSYPQELDTEMAMYRIAQIQWNQFKDGVAASSCLAEMKRRFPRGHLINYANNIQKQIQAG